MIRSLTVKESDYKSDPMIHNHKSQEPFLQWFQIKLTIRWPVVNSKFAWRSEFIQKYQATK